MTDHTAQFIVSLASVSFCLVMLLIFYFFALVPCLKLLKSKP